ncbi:hypothetical protein QVD17_27187 [Tagetes erecta]|uniref:Uncharacterized protein n=1 Tax=Tagetes erecta TaxID=13708 RepID=A0AAD8NJ57_TARER|nr:hypothetical protein QVD17_27187 [Tagetes erecta]
MENTTLLAASVSVEMRHSINILTLDDFILRGISSNTWSAVQSGLSPENFIDFGLMFKVFTTKYKRVLTPEKSRSID